MHVDVVQYHFATQEVKDLIVRPWRDREHLGQKTRFEQNFNFETNRTEQNQQCDRNVILVLFKFHENTKQQTARLFLFLTLKPQARLNIGPDHIPVFFLKIQKWFKRGQNYCF